jgi:hypothetical protein
MLTLSVLANFFKIYQISKLELTLLLLLLAFSPILSYFLTPKWRYVFLLSNGRDFSFSEVDMFGCHGFFVL